MLTRTHEPFYADQVAGMPSARVLFSLATGVRLLQFYCLMRLCEMDPKGIVGFFPSDHYFSDDEAFAGQVALAYAIAANQPEVIILLGITPEAPETEYGWIEPGVPFESPVPNCVSRVSRFWEKPPQTLASALMERGCLWNSFVMIGHVNAYLKLIRNAVPGLVKLFESVRPSLFTASETAAVSDLYSIIRATSFSQDVLSARPIDLAVLRGIGLGWSDLGVPCRVLSLLESKGVQTEWGSKQGGWRADAAVATG